MLAACNRIVRLLCRLSGKASDRVTKMPDSNKVKVNYFCLGAFFIFAGSVLLCALGFTVVLPFEATRSWPEVVCLVVNSTYDRNVCSCDDQPNVFDMCISKYPCLLIRVSYNQSSRTLQPKSIRSVTQPSDVFQSEVLPAAGANVGSEEYDSKETFPFSTVMDRRPEDAETKTTSIPRVFASPQYSTQSAALHRQGNSGDSSGPGIWLGHERGDGKGGGLLPPLAPRNVSAEPTTPATEGWGGNVAKLYRSWDDSFYSECSLTECGDETWNVNQSRRFKADYGRLGRTFPCFYNPARPDMVIIERTSPTAAIHAVLWPGLCLALGIMLWLGLCVGCWSIKGDGGSKEDYGPLYS